MAKQADPTNGGDIDRSGWAGRVSPQAFVAVIVIAAVLHIGRDVFLPLAIATLIAFALSPLVSALRKSGLPRMIAVISTVVATFAILGFIFTVMGSQLSSVANDLPTFQTNILTKLDDLKKAERNPAVFGRVIDMLTRITPELKSAMPSGEGAAAPQPMADKPVAVAVVQDKNPWQVLSNTLVPILGPIVTAGLVIVIVIFILADREELRDRFIRLVGSNDLHRTSQIIEDAGSRVARYLLFQLLVNVIYSVPIGLGLWAIGVPSPFLWALITLLMRFVPYFGTALSAALPLFVAFAASPGWSMMLWTAALFITVELVTSYLIEPWLYGSRTGLSPLAVIVSAIIWTSLWGPMGLILSTPLTVCLVVFGRHLPQFEIFDILFGDEPALKDHARLYQRLLAGDVLESAARAEEALETAYLSDFYQEVGIPALLLAQNDFDRGVLSEMQEERISKASLRLVDALQPVLSEELDELSAGGAAPGEDEGRARPAPDATGKRVVVTGGRSRLDDAAAAMLGQAIAALGVEVRTLSRGDLATASNLAFGDDTPTCVMLNFLNSSPARASLLIVRRLKRALPKTRVGVIVWHPEDMDMAPAAWGANLSEAAAGTLAVANEIGADFVATTMREAEEMCLAEVDPKPLIEQRKRQPRRQAQQALSQAANR